MTMMTTRMTPDNRKTIMPTTMMIMITALIIMIVMIMMTTLMVMITAILIMLTTMDKDGDKDDIGDSDCVDNDSDDKLSRQF